MDDKKTVRGPHEDAAWTCSSVERDMNQIIEHYGLGELYTLIRRKIEERQATGVILFPSNDAFPIGHCPYWVAFFEYLGRDEIVQVVDDLRRECPWLKNDQIHRRVAICEALYSEGDREGDWALDDTNERLISISRADEARVLTVSQSVQEALFVRLSSEDEVLLVVDALARHTRWVVPNLCASASPQVIAHLVGTEDAAPTVSRVSYSTRVERVFQGTLVQANILEHGRSLGLVLRLKTALSEPGHHPAWRATPVVQHAAMARYLSRFGVPA